MEITKFDFLDYQRTGDINIRNKIAEFYKGFSEEVSKRFYYKARFHMGKKRFLNCFVEFDKEDFVEHGFLGLLEAIKEYNPFNEKNASFKTYSRHRILGQIKDELRKPLFFSGPLKRNDNPIPLVFSLDRGVKNNNDRRFEYEKTNRNLRDEKNVILAKKRLFADFISSFLNDGHSKRDYQIFVDHRLGDYTLKEAAERAGIKESRACQIDLLIMDQVKSQIEKRKLKCVDFIN